MSSEGVFPKCTDRSYMPTDGKDQGEAEQMYIFCFDDGNSTLDGNLSEHNA